MDMQSIEVWVSMLLILAAIVMGTYLLTKANGPAKESKKETITSPPPVGLKKEKEDTGKKAGTVGSGGTSSKGPSKLVIPSSMTTEKDKKSEKHIPVAVVIYNYNESKAKWWCSNCEVENDLAVNKCYVCGFLR